MGDITEGHFPIDNQIDHWLIAQIVCDGQTGLIGEIERGWK